MERLRFDGRKSFGFFNDCCGAAWVSARAFKEEYRQQCKRCKQWSQPTYMWHNFPSSSGSDERKKPQKNKPHHADKCEACRAGVPCVVESDLADMLAELNF